jgi:hypothetical protein
MLKTLDLFAGVGGITHALRGFAAPAMYCEIDPHAQAVLKKLMGQGTLPRAPIHADVTTLDGKALRGKIDMITAGWPCTGMSSGGKREGFANEQSGLYAHVVRLIREASPPLVFMENVAPVIDLGLDDVLATLGKAGYEASWVVLYAYNAGSPQLRRRWFCLAHKPEAVGTRVKLRGAPFVPFGWGREPVPRMLPQRPPYVRNRLAMMGNGVVPDVVRLAFCWLFAGGVAGGADASATQLTLRRPPPGKPFAPGAQRLCGTFVGKKVLSIECPRGLRARPNLGLVLDPAALPLPERINPLMTTERLTQPIGLQTWATPRRGITHGARVLTRRCKQDLPTQLRFERSTPAGSRAGYVNPQWVEWLMGFDTDWTAVPTSAALPDSVADPDDLSAKGASVVTLAAGGGGGGGKKKRSSAPASSAPSSSARSRASAGGRGTTPAGATPSANLTRTSSDSSVSARSAGSSTRASRSR